MRIYVAGPMTGIPKLNFPAFHAAAAALRAEGHHVENPAEINADPEAQWLDCMRMDIARLVTCDAVYMLLGWEKSRGALVEHTLATGLGLHVLYDAIRVARAAWIAQCAARYSWAGCVESVAAELAAASATKQAEQYGDDSLAWEAAADAADDEMICWELTARPVQSAGSQL